MSSSTARPVPLWAGLECTINRVGDHWSDQARFSGHHTRGLRDIEAIADLGVRAVRYPVLWETVAPDRLDRLEWGRIDGRLERLRDRGVEVIAGLLHHGSGPAYTSLIDADFPEKLARYAGEAARRYPWLGLYTPVNEPLTTARFSGLYGIWYPHGRDDGTFLRALYNEVRGTVLAMGAIRAVNPEARLVQTDDLGRATGTPGTAKQVEFENERRWLSFDLLLGRVGPAHPLYGYLTAPGRLTPGELRWLEDNPCPPDIIGLNHYLLSNRFLDEETHWYPDHVPRGRIGDVEYADVPAFETGRAESPRVEAVLTDAWERYPGIPLAVTEVHIDGDDALRQQWLWEVWGAANALRREGAPMVAVTVWSLFGTFDWNTLCTTPPGEPTYYEPGVFDVRSGDALPTTVADMVRSLASLGTHEHPSLSRDSFWATQAGLKYAHVSAGDQQLRMAGAHP